MTPLEIIEGNVLISRFCEFSLKSFEVPEVNEFTNQIEYRTGTLGDLKYHEDWNWLMSACKKWDDLDITKSSYVKLCDELDNLVACYEIIPVFCCLVKCLKWYDNEIETLRVQR